MLFQIVFAAGFIMLASLVGVLFVALTAKRFLETKLSFLVSFSAGVFLVTSGALALEVFEIFETSLFLAVILILAGYIMAWGIDFLLPDSHHHHDPNNHDGHTHTRGGARKLLIGDAIHNIGDGIILVPAFFISPAIGMAVAVSIFIHEGLQEISEFFVLKQAGYSTKRALLLNFATSSTIFIGIIISYIALASHELEGAILAISAGFFFHVVVHDLLPRPDAHTSTKKFLIHVGLVGVGLLLMAFINNLLAEEHAHGEEAIVENVSL